MVTRLVLIFIFLCFNFGCTSQSQLSSTSVTIGGEVFTLELSVDKQSRVTGMMHREEIPKNEGMLFIFPDSVERSFWMKNCLVDIDIMFLDSRGTVISTYTMSVEPTQKPNETNWEYESRLTNYWSNGPARFAIELAAGSIDRLGVHTNDQIPLDLPILRPLAR